MPPVYRKIIVTQHFDGNSDLDLRKQGINLVYIADWLNSDLADNIFAGLGRDGDILRQHSYVGNFGRRVTPKRLTHAHVPDGRLYRYKGRPLYRYHSETFEEVFHQLVDRLPPIFTTPPDAAITNGYRYNGIDYIAPHTDDEKFLSQDNCTYWSDSTVCTVTLLRNPELRMQYYAADPVSARGVSIAAKHGSIIIQGSVLHEIRPFPRTIGSEIGRISVTLRCLKSTCSHRAGCRKPNCSHNLGPSNYLYYSNPNALCQTPAVSLDLDELLVSDSGENIDDLVVSD